MPRWENGFQTSEEIQRFKRYAVIREAARIMSRQGFHNTSLDEVAKVLGISKGTLYNYVKDKQEILFECHNIGVDLGEHATAIAKDSGKLGIDKLRLLLRCYIIWMYGQAGVGGVTYDVNALRAEDRAAIIKRRDSMDENLVGLIKEGVSDGSIRPCDAKVAIFGIMGAINSISIWFSPDGRLTIEEVANELLDLLTLSLATRPKDLAPYPPIPAYPSPETPLKFFNRNSGGAARQDKPVSRKATTPATRTKASPTPQKKGRSTKVQPIT